jgi:hypothetical protein
VSYDSKVRRCFSVNLPSNAWYILWSGKYGTAPNDGIKKVVEIVVMKTNDHSLNRNMLQLEAEVEMLENDISLSRWK